MCDCEKCNNNCGCDKNEEKKDDQKKDQGQEKYTEEEEKMIKAKLKGLGYLD